MQHDTLVSIARPYEKTICALHSIALFLPKIPTFLHKRGTSAGRHIPRARRIGLSVQQGGIPVKKDRFRRLAAMALAAATVRGLILTVSHQEQIGVLYPQVLETLVRGACRELFA